MESQTVTTSRVGPRRVAEDSRERVAPIRPKPRFRIAVSGPPAFLHGIELAGTVGAVMALGSLTASPYGGESLLAWILIAVVCWAVSLSLYGLVPADTSKRVVSPEWDREAGFVAAVFVTALFARSPELPVSGFVGLIAIHFALHTLVFLAARSTLVLRRQESLRDTSIYIYGAGSVGRMLARTIDDHPELGVEVVGFLDDRVTNAPGRPEPVLGSLEDLESVLRQRPASEIVVALPLSSTDTMRQVVAIAELNGLRVRLVPEYFTAFGSDRIQTTAVGDIPLLNVDAIPLDSARNRVAKRAFDIAFSSVALIALSPLLAAIAIAVWVSSPGSVVYAPYRLGLGGKPFRCYKFRTMVNSEDPNPTQSTKVNDPRVTKLGTFLRRWSLDELPQFWNVLTGDMSIVGPRPHRVSLNEALKHEVPGYMTRHFVRPGITGWAQVNGWRGPTDTAERRIQRTLHDLWYVEHWSLALDVKVVFRTVTEVFAGRNAF
jgi:putative colanic acid biosynthesis UDP-glucose lipid carrier transferase